MQIRLTVLLVTLLAFSRTSHALIALEGGGGGYTPPPPPPPTNNKIVYLQGRSQDSWPVFLSHSSAWNDVRVAYNGSSHLGDSTARANINSALSTNCRYPNQCVVVCYSAGCLRMLQSLNELRAAGTPADKILWIEAPASAAGGTQVADAATRWWVKILAKLFGGSADIDNELKKNYARYNMGYVQNEAPVAMYHLAGGHNMCKRVAWFFKVCGNKYLPGHVGDGAVGPSSACGYATDSADSGLIHTSCCDGGYYTNRNPESCALDYNNDHRGMFGRGVVSASSRLAYTATLSYAPYDDTSATEGGVTGDESDTPATSTTGPWGAPSAGEVPVTSDTCSYSDSYGCRVDSSGTYYTPQYTGGGGGGGSTYTQQQAL